MKKINLALLCILIITVLFPLTAHADMGPKPSVVIDFRGLEGKTYYATLLSEAKSTGPYSAVEMGEGYIRFDESDEDYDIFLKFAGYKDPDGFYFLQFFTDCTVSNRFAWTYFPPGVFKILLYFPESDSFIASDVLERYAFDSYFRAEVSEGDTGISVKKSYDYTNEILSLLARIVLTVLAELGIALLFGFREKRQFRFSIIVNVITQAGLNLALNFINYHAGALAFLFSYILLEGGVIIAEAVLYTFYLLRYSQKKVPGWKPVVYALAANAVSFVLGLILALWIPGIF